MRLHHTLVAIIGGLIGLHSLGACGGRVDSSSAQALAASGPGGPGGGAPSPSPSSSTDSPPTVAASGGAAAVIETTLRGDYSAIAADELHLYLAGRPGIARVAKAGGPPVMLLEEDGFKTGIAVDETYVYFTRLVDGEVARIAKDGTGKAEIVARDQVRPRGITVDEDNVYWACEGDDLSGRMKDEGGQIASHSKTDLSAPVHVLAANEQQAKSVVLGGEWLYLVTGVSGGHNGTIKRVKKTGGDAPNAAVETLADRRATLGVPSLTIADGWIAWVEQFENGFKLPIEPTVAVAESKERRVVSLGRATAIAGNGNELFGVSKSEQRLQVNAHPLIGDETPIWKASRTFGKDQTWLINAVIADAQRIYWLDYWWSYADAGPYSGVHSVPR